MKHRAYPAYKPSGVAWLGEIPGHWKMSRLKHIARFTTGWTPPTSKDEYYFGANPWATIADLGPRLLGDPKGRISDDAIASSRMRISPKGSLLFSFKLSIGQVSIADRDLYTNEAIATFPPDNGTDVGYLYWSAPLFIPMNADENIYGAKLLGQETIKNATFAVPPSDEQRTIAAFLDRETERIDALIEKKQRQIELLQEKRSALISHAVTKGLDPDARMKDSGIEWLGEIPEHWEVRRLKYTATINDEALPETTEPDYEFTYVDIGSVDANRGIVKTETYRFEHAPSRARRIVRNGDTIVSTVRTYLRAIASIRNPQENLIVSTGFAVVRPHKLNPGYFSYALRSPFFIETVVSCSTGVSYPAINAPEVGNIGITIPPLSEQQAIADFLDRETARIDALIEKVQSSIAMLREYRTALISAAVTGKIDVRKEVAVA